MHFLVLTTILSVLHIGQVIAVGNVKDIIDYCDSSRHDIITSLELSGSNCFVRCGDWSEDGFHYTEFEMLCEVIDPKGYCTQVQESITKLNGVACALSCENNDANKSLTLQTTKMAFVCYVKIPH